MPKEMLPILDKPTIQYIVEEAARAGIEDIIIVTGRHKRAIEDHFDIKRIRNGFKRKGKSELLEKFSIQRNLRIFLCKAERTKRFRACD